MSHNSYGNINYHQILLSIIIFFSFPISVHLGWINILSVVVLCVGVQVEQLGCEGKVEEAQGVMKLCDKLKEERTQLQRVMSPALFCGDSRV